MSIDLGTRSSAVVDGRCTGCGRFISRNESHFHSPPRKFRYRPKAHLWIEGGGMVTRCDDIAEAQALIVAKYLRVEVGSLVDDIDRHVATQMFSPERAVVQRGRINVVAPESDEVSWWWMALPADAKGPGITTAVVWNP